VPNPCPNASERVRSGKRDDARKPCSGATSRHTRTPPAIAPASLGDLEVPSSNLGAPTEGKSCKLGFRAASLGCCDHASKD
jgi:hypothetical protein